jgi:glycosyltransferase involved in cell wall biosynthesis
MTDVTVVLTACNRPDLLERTMESFVQHNTYPIKEFIIIDDGLVEGCNDFLKDKYDLPFTFLYNKVKLAQIRSIDLAYSRVKTPYIFHMEEDWLFLLPGFIEKSMEIMETDSNIITVWLRSPQDNTLKHPYSEETYSTVRGVEFKKCHVFYPNGIWNGFTLNPSLKRLKDYDRVKPYQQLPRITPYQQSGNNPLECDISIAYAQLGYYAVTLLDQYIEHIGWDRHLI